MGIYDFEKMGDNMNIFLCYKTLSYFQTETKQIPKNWCLKDSEHFEKLLKQTSEPYKLSEEELESLVKFGRNFSFVAEA